MRRISSASMTEELTPSAACAAALAARRVRCAVGSIQRNPVTVNPLSPPTRSPQWRNQSWAAHASFASASSS